MVEFDLGRRGLLRATGGCVAGVSAFPGFAATGEARAGGTASEPTVVSSSIRHVEGTEPDMDDVLVDPKVRGNHVMVHVDALDRQRQAETREELPRSELRTGDLQAVGADHSTTFEIEVVVESFAPRLLVGRSRGLRWEREFRDDGTVALTVEVQPAEKQTNSDDPRIDDWPDGEDDRATRAVSQNVSFAVFSHEEHPEEFRQRIDGTVVGSNAQVIGTPALRTDERGRERLEITVAGSHYTVSGDVYEGFYYAMLAPPLLDAWGVSGPGQLVAWYDGDEADFEAERVGDAILVEVDVHYSVASVEVGPAESSAGEGPDDDATGPDGRDDATSGDGDDADVLVPGFGAAGAIAGLGGAAYALKRRLAGEGGPD